MRRRGLAGGAAAVPAHGPRKMPWPREANSVPLFAGGQDCFSFEEQAGDFTVVIREPGLGLVGDQHVEHFGLLDLAGAGVKSAGVLSPRLGVSAERSLFLLRRAIYDPFHFAKTHSVKAIAQGVPMRVRA